MFRFLWDFLRYPFDKHHETNKFHLFLNFVFKEYPAFFWLRPTFKKILLFPIISIYLIFRPKKI